jgi:hypothetical protein
VVSLITTVLFWRDTVQERDRLSGTNRLLQNLDPSLGALAGPACVKARTRRDRL